MLITYVYDDETTFQIGDCCTKTYINDKNNLIVINSGDVSSIVEIEFS